MTATDTARLRSPAGILIQNRSYRLFSGARRCYDRSILGSAQSGECFLIGAILLESLKRPIYRDVD
jgi:hypothetical protein